MLPPTAPPPPALPRKGGGSKSPPLPRVRGRGAFNEARMRISQIDCHLLKVPLSRPRASLNEAAAGRLNHISVLLVRLDVDAGLSGLGFAYTLQGSGRALHAAAVHDISPPLHAQDTPPHQRLPAH